MELETPAENSAGVELSPALGSSASRRSVAVISDHYPRSQSNHRRSSKHVRYDSRAGESEAFGASHRETIVDDKDSRLVHLNDPARTNERFEFAANLVRTSKYSVLTFLPRNLFEQFHRVAYIYLLVIAVLNQLPQLAVFGRRASILPLTFVLLVTTVKDAYEDYRRHRSDKIENNRLALVLSGNQFRPKNWKDIQVGEILKIRANETIPCNMVLLSTSGPTAINLDGESNLKIRYAKQETLSKCPEKDGVCGSIWCERPNRNIYGFQANLEIDGKKLSLGPLNALLRGCELKNTCWAIGVAGRKPCSTVPGCLANGAGLSPG